MGAVLAVDVLVVGVLWKELKLSTFDPALALALGFAPAVLNYVLMTLVSVTAVGAFNAVGSILVVALMIAPPAAAYLLTDGLGRMTALACAIGGGSALAGYWLAVVVDASIAGCIAACTGIAFALAWGFAPDAGSSRHRAVAPASASSSPRQCSRSTSRTTRASRGGGREPGRTPRRAPALGRRRAGYRVVRTRGEASSSAAPRSWR